MIYRMITDDTEIYKDEGADHGIVMSVTWADIHLVDALAGTYVLRIAEGGCTTIDDHEFIVEMIYIHPESDSIWAYVRDPNNNQLWCIDFGDQLYKYNTGIGQLPQV